MSAGLTASAARRLNKQSTTLTFTLMATPILNAMELERKINVPDSSRLICEVAGKSQPE